MTFHSRFYPAVAFQAFFLFFFNLKEVKFDSLVSMLPMLVFLRISGVFIFFIAGTVQAGLPLRQPQISRVHFVCKFMQRSHSCWSPIPFSPSSFLQEYCEPCLHGKFNPFNRHFQNTLLMFPQMLELDLKCQAPLSEESTQKTKYNVL